jgi:hypothetical protein
MKLEYIIPHKGNNLGRIFGVMEANKSAYYIADYSVSQTTLDQVFINFAKSSTKSSESDPEDSFGPDSDQDLDENQNEDDSIFETDLDKKDTIKMDLPLDRDIWPHVNDNMTNQTNVNMNDTPTFESIKNHFNSLKKSRHIRKTSSAKSQDFKQSMNSRKSLRSRSSSIRQRKSINEEGGYNNLAYEIEYKNSDAYEFPIQESSHDLTTSINEDGEYYSRC